MATLLTPVGAWGGEPEACGGDVFSILWVSAHDHLRCGAWIVVVMAVAAVAKWGGAGSETTNLGAGDARGSY